MNLLRKIISTMAEKSLENYSIADYLVIDNQSDTKNEYFNGVIIGMAGGTLNHGIIGNNINTAINNGLRANEKKCTAINGDVKIYIEKANSIVYPDGMVICGAIKTAELDQNSVTNPILIVEVLSQSTERNDRGSKFHKYCSLPSFREYVLIDQYQPVIDILYRSEEKYWKMVTIIGLDKSIYLNSIQLEIKMADIYRNTIKLNNPQFSLDL